MFRVIRDIRTSKIQDMTIKFKSKATMSTYIRWTIFTKKRKRASSQRNRDNGRKESKGRRRKVGINKTEDKEGR